MKINVLDHILAAYPTHPRHYILLFIQFNEKRNAFRDTLFRNTY